MRVTVSENRVNRQRVRRRVRPYPPLELLTGSTRYYNGPRRRKITASSTKTRGDTQTQTETPFREEGIGGARVNQCAGLHKNRPAGSHIMEVPSEGAYYTGSVNSNNCSSNDHAGPLAIKNQIWTVSNRVEEHQESPKAMLTTALNIYAQKLYELSDKIHNLQWVETDGREKEGSKGTENYPNGIELTAPAGPRIGRKGLLRIKALMGLILNKIIQKRSEELQHSPDLFDCTWPNKNYFVLYVRNPSKITNYEYAKEKLFTQGLAPAVTMVLPDNGVPHPTYEIILGAVEGLFDRFHNSKNAVPKVMEMVASIPKAMIPVFNMACDRWLKDSGLLTTMPTGLFGRNL